MADPIREAEEALATFDAFCAQSIDEENSDAPTLREAVLAMESALRALLPHARGLEKANREAEQEFTRELAAKKAAESALAMKRREYDVEAEVHNATRHERDRLLAECERLEDEDGKRIERLCNAAGIYSPLQLSALATTNEETTLDLLVRRIAVLYKAESALAAERRRSEEEARLVAIRIYEPKEVVKDEFAYDRMVEAYRLAAASPAPPAGDGVRELPEAVREALRMLDDTITAPMRETFMHAPKCPCRDCCAVRVSEALSALSAPQPAAPGDGEAVRRPRIVCLCGSTRFYDAFQEANYQLTMAGKIVLSVGFYPHSKAQHGHGEGVGHDSAEKVALDELHKRKIDLADEVLVLNVGGYIGESTRGEVSYAERLGKPVAYLEPLDAAKGGRS